MLSLQVDEKSPADNVQTWSLEHAVHTFYLISITVLWSVVLTFVPVFVDLESSTDNMYYKRGWYNAADIVRFIEPIGGMPLNLAILLRSGLLTRGNAPLILIVFTFAGTIYVQGAAFHSASVMFKHAVERYDDLYAGNRYITDMLYWIRTVWEHIISHYLYVAGYAVFIACIAWVYKDHQLEPAAEGRLGKLYAAVGASTILYAILVSGVAINFPSGCIVGLIYILGYGIGVNGYLLREAGAWSALQQGGWSSMRTWSDVLCRRPILVYYLASHVLALVILICWIAAAGGFYSRSEAAKN